MDLIGGTFSPNDGSASPLLANHAYYTLAKDLGVEFRFSEPVIALHLNQDKIDSVVTTSGKYSSRGRDQCSRGKSSRDRKNGRD